MSSSMKAPKCPKCGSPVVPGEESCGNCHTRLTWSLDGSEVRISGWQAISDFGGWMANAGILMLVIVALSLLTKGCS